MSFMSAGMRGGPRGMLQGYGEGGNERKGLNWRVLMRLFRFVRPYRRQMAIGLVLMLVVSASQLLGPYLVRTAIDSYIRPGDLNGLVIICAVLALVYVVGALASGWQDKVLGQLGQAVLRDMRTALFDHMQRLPMSYYDRADAGRLVSYMVSDVSVINELLASGLVTLVGDTLMLVGIVAIMLSMNVRLALLSFTVIPAMVLLTWWFSYRAADTYRLTRQKVGAMIGRLAEDLSTVRVIKAFAEDDRAQREFETTNRENRDANVAAMALAFAFRPGVDLLAAAASIIVIWCGGLWAAQGLVTVGTIVAFLTYVTRFFQPIQELSMLFTTVQSAAAGGERILGLLDTDPAIADRPGAIELENLGGSVEFRDVDFAYVPGEPIFKNFNLWVRAGEKVAVVGPTGAGKSTIAKLVARHYEVDDGAVMVDEHDVRDVTLVSLRRRVGVVPQEPFLFAGTIADNIRFGKPDAGMDAVREAAEMARAAQFIEALPQGYDTWVQEGAVNLSLGQRQLVCLARVMLTRPSLIILDEATSSVDTRTEQLIQAALDQLMAGRTAIIIAHRLATVRSVDRILVLDDGKVVEEGTHEALLGQGGLYSTLYRTQMALA